MLAPNTTLQNRYQILRLLGQGGMGAVYLAFDHRLNQNVALKENTGGDARQFQHEAELLARLRHPNLPRVSDHFIEPNGVQYLVMDYIEGDDLETLRQQRGALPEAQVRAWFAQILSAVEYLHSQGVIHRDIKPDNIKITPSGQAVLVDFGIAKIYQAGQVTRSSQKFGSTGYASPEHYKGGTNQQSDIYSLGATLYAVLTGGPPPDAQSLELGTAILVPPHNVNPQVTPQVEQVIHKALMPKPTERYSSANDFSQAFNAVIGVPAKGRYQNTPPAMMSRGIPRNGLFVWGGLAAVLMLVVAVVLVRPFSLLENPIPTAIPTLVPSLVPTRLSVANPTPPPQTPLSAILQSVATLRASTLPAGTATPNQSATPDFENTRIASLFQGTLSAEQTQTVGAEQIIQQFIQTATWSADATVRARPTNTPPPPARATTTQTPTAIPPPTQTRIPRGVWVTKVEAVPGHVSPDSTAYFRTTFLNSTNGVAYFNWCVEIFQQGSRDRAFGNTECKPRTIPVGETTFNTEPYKTGCGVYELRAIWIDASNKRFVITKPDGSTAWASYSVCP